MPKPSYRGTISFEEARRGILAAGENARDLVADAALLLENDRSARSLALSLFAIEECAKVTIIAHLSLAETEKAAEPLWQKFLDHKHKSVVIALHQFTASIKDEVLDERNWERLGAQFQKVTTGKSDHNRTVMEFRNRSLYADRDGHGGWTTPRWFILRGEAEKLLAKAREGTDTPWFRGLQDPTTFALWVEMLGSARPRFPTSADEWSKRQIAFLKKAGRRGLAIAEALPSGL